MLKCILIFIFIVHLCSVISQYNFQIHNRRSVKDLPVQEDLDKFLYPIETLTNYLSNNITEIELNHVLGIFITNVHFRRVLLNKGQNIPNQMLSRINAIVDTNEQVLLYFHKTAKNDIEFIERDEVIISDLFVNSTYWALRLKEMKYVAEPSYSFSDLEVKYSKWKIYSDKVSMVYDWTPSPKNSDTCLVILAINPKFKGNSTSWCPMAKTCFDMLTKGTNFGYSLCHRIMLLIFAQLGRGCYIQLGLDDEALKDKLCIMAYAEAEYIAMNNFGLADLLMEIMCICGMDGRVQFLQRKWLHKMFDFQNKIGCFDVRNTRPTYRSISRRKKLANCNSHTQSLAVGTYAAAVRFILEEYY